MVAVVAEPARPGRAADGGAGACGPLDASWLTDDSLQKGPPPDDAGALISACAAQVAEQRRRLERLQARVRALRAAAVEAAQNEEAATSREKVAREARLERIRAETEAARADEDKLRAQARHGEAAAAKLRDVVASRQSAVEELRQKVEEANAELQEIRGEEEQRLHSTPMGCQAAMLRQALAHWDGPHGSRRLCAECFARADANHDARLEWNNGEIRAFARTVFQESSVTVPHWSDLAWYNIYRQFDADGSLSLELEEAIRFVKFCFEVALRAADPSADVRAFSPGPASASPSAPASPTRAPRVATLRKALSDWQERPEELESICRECFGQVDVDGDGRLQWNNDEIRGFLRTMLWRFEIPPPLWPDQRWYDLYRRVDLDRSRSIDADEAPTLAKRCFEELCEALCAK